MMLFTTFLGQNAIIILESLWWYLKEATREDHRGKRLMFSWAFQNLQAPLSFKSFLIVKHNNLPKIHVPALFVIISLPLYFYYLNINPNYFI